MIQSESLKIEADNTRAADESQRSSRPQPLRILIDARKILDGGIGVYTQNLIVGLLAQNEYVPSGDTFIGMPNTSVEIGLLGNPKILEKFPWMGMVEIVEEKARPYSLDEIFRLGRRVQKQINSSGYKLFHTPHYVLPYGLDIPSVITLHDLIHLFHPANKFQAFVAQQLIRSALNRATRVLTVSRGSMNDIKSFVGENSPIIEKLSLVPNALDPFYLNTPLSVRTLMGGNIRDEIRAIKGDYLLSVFSTVKPHKGLSDLLQAFESIKLKISTRGLLSSQRNSGIDSRRNLKLVLVGQGIDAQGKRVSAEMRQAIRYARQSSDVVVLGEVTKEELYHLYGGAVALVIPSLLEGFCLPALESQAVGTPVVARPIPALLEICSSEDSIARDMSIQALETAIDQVLERPRVPGARVRRREELSKRYDRRRIGKNILHVYQQALGIVS